MANYVLFSTSEGLEETMEKILDDQMENTLEKNYFPQDEMY